MKDLEKKSKLKVLGEMNKMASEMMKEGLQGKKDLKKVTVASDSKEGLQKGLKKAEEVLEDEDLDEDEESEEIESEEESDEIDEEMDEEAIDAEIEKLLALKEKLSK